MKRELFVRFVIEKIETCPIDVCHESVLKQKGSEASTDGDFLSIPENPKNCTLASLLNTELLTSFFVNFFHILKTVILEKGYEQILLTGHFKWFLTDTAQK